MPIRLRIGIASREPALSEVEGDLLFAFQGKQME
jgi:hypothetical protein